MNIIELAQECKLVTTENREGIYSEALMRFARMAMQHEREECAKAVEAEAHMFATSASAASLADAIRERNNT
jgi:hypothetical protein